MQKLLFIIVFVCSSAGNVSADSLAEAHTLFESGKPEQAMLKVNNYLRTKPGSAEARFLKALILVEQGNSGAAIGVFTALTRDYPELPEPYNNIAVNHAAEGDYDSARAALQAALKTHPSYATAYENLGDIYAKLASEAYQQALDLEKRDQGQGKLKVKLSLIGNLFMEEAQASSEVVAASAPVKQRPVSKPVAVVTKPPVAVRPAITETASKPVRASSQLNHRALITKTIQSWASAWSAQDVAAYLSYYADSFKPARGSASKWRAQRHARLTKPKYIRIALDKIKWLKIGEKDAKIELVQTYESNTYRDKSRKRFDLVRVNGQWKINREVSI